MESLESIKTVRKRYHLNQKQLAEKAGVSQSLIAKIESGKVDPTFTKAQKIFAALEELRDTHELKADDVMRTKVLFAKSADHLKNIIKIMKSRGISQLPVNDKGVIVGLVSEGTILAHLDKINTAHVNEVMDDAPPIISPKTSLRVVSELLKDHQIVLVAEKGNVNGIISKTDVLGKAE